MPLVSAQTRRGGSLRLSFVSVERALWVGPRKAVQSWVTASLASGFACETTWVCAAASLVASAFADKASNIARRDMIDMGPASYLSRGRVEVGTIPDAVSAGVTLGVSSSGNSWSGAMLSRLVKVVPAIILAIGTLPAPARGECVRLSPNQLLERPDAELVFAGRVVQVTRTGELGYRATFEVDRVWMVTVARWRP